MGIQYLVSWNLLEDDPKSVAEFLINQKGLSKEKIGEFMGDIMSEFNMAVLEFLVEHMHIDGKPIEEALREFLQIFNMPGEAQKIDKIMEVFSMEYFKRNKSMGVFKNEDGPYILSYSIIMLNTSLHNPSLKSRPTVERFLSVNGGINDGEDLPRLFLQEIFDKIQAKPLIPGQDHTNVVATLEEQITKLPIPKLNMPQRYLVHRCMVMEVQAPMTQPSFRNEHHRQLFFFNDIAIVCKKKNQEQYIFSDMFSLSNLVYIKFETSFYKHGIQLQSVDRESPYQFNCDSHAERELIIQHLEDIINFLKLLESEDTAELSTELEPKGMGMSKSFSMEESTIEKAVHTDNNHDSGKQSIEDPIYSATSINKLSIEHLPKTTIIGVDYQSFCNKIEFLLFTASDYEFKAATTYLHSPSVENNTATQDTATGLQPNIAIGTFAGGPIALIRSSSNKHTRDLFADIRVMFPEVKYVISTGTGHAFQEKLKLGDVFISDGVTAITDYSIATEGSTAHLCIQGNHIETFDLLQTIFCLDSNIETNFQVTDSRTATYYISNIVSGIGISEDSRLHNKNDIRLDSGAIAGDINGYELMELQSDGIIKGFIVIKSVTEFIGRKMMEGALKKEAWNFTGTMAAIHYIEQKMIPYMYHVTSVDHYMSALKSGDVVNVMVAKLIFLGPPMQGKTVTRQRLTKAITNLHDVSSSHLDLSNTGVSEQKTVFICKDMLRATAIAKEDDWVTVNIEEEIHFCMNATKEEVEIPSYDEKEADDLDDLHMQTSFEYQQESECINLETPSQPTNLFNVEREVAENEDSFEKKKPSLLTSAELSAVHVNWAKSVLSSGTFTKKNKSFNLERLSTQLNKGCLLYMQDTGGQPELMECLPVLTIGPALYLLFCKLTSRLDDTYQIGYRGPDGASLPFQSHFTMKETLLSAMASVASMTYSSTNQDKDIEKVMNREGFIYIVGTHRDEMEPESIDHFELQLQKILESTFFYEKDLINWWHKVDLPPEIGLHSRGIQSRLVYPLDNKFGSIKEIECLRSSIHKRLTSLFGNQKIPTSWLVFGICLRQSEESIVTLNSCFELGLELKMSDTTVMAALHFLHYNLGICMHFSNIPALKDIVIPNTQLIYKSLTTLIEISFKPCRAAPADIKEFKNTGQFLVKKFERASDFTLPLKTLVLILTHLNIVTPVNSDNSSKCLYFMPCVLPNASNDEIASFERVNPIPEIHSPLYIKYECGFVPIGVFSSMIACLIQKSNFQYDDFKGIFLKKDHLRRNHIQFWCGCDVITFFHTPEYIRIHISQKEENIQHIHELCNRVRNIVKKTLLSVTASMLNSLYTTTSENQYKSHFQSYKFAFKCYGHSAHDHLCVVTSEDKPKFMNCVWDGNNTPFEMRPDNLVWYGKELPESKALGDGESVNASHLTLLKWTDSRGCVQRLRILEEIGTCWKEMATLIGLNFGRIEAIESYRRGNVKDCCRDVFDEWLKQDKGKYPATWKGICELLEDINLSAAAEKIKNWRLSTS